MGQLNYIDGYNDIGALVSGYAQDYEGYFCNNAKNKYVSGKTWIIADRYAGPAQFYDSSNWKEVFPIYIDDYEIKKLSDLDLVGVEFKSSYFQFCVYEKGQQYRKILNTMKFRDLSQLEEFKTMAKKLLNSPSNKKKIVFRLITIAEDTDDIEEWIQD